MVNNRSKRLVVANWKMNPSGESLALKLFLGIKKSASKATNVQTVVCAPHIYVSTLVKEVSGHRLVVGAQDAYFEKSGAYTGEVSASQLGSSGVEYVIVGHSERRQMGERDELVSMKLGGVLKEGMHAILCVGEQTRDTDGEYLNFIKKQLENSLRGIPRRHFLNLVVAYEPLWAISTHATGVETPEDVLQMSIFIRKTLGAICGKDIAVGVPIIYGGSVDNETASSFVQEGGADGVLVGKASLSSDTFGKIIKSINAVKDN